MRDAGDDVEGETSLLLTREKNERSPITVVDYRWRPYVVWGVLALLAISSAGRLVAYEPVPWGWVAGFGVLAFLLSGPVTWAVRVRVSGERRDLLVYVAAGAALFSVPFVITLGLLSGTLLLILDAGTPGSVAGIAAAAFVERTVVPERLRGATL